MSIANQIFRFLDLPPELRLLVYEHLPCSTIHHTITQARDFANGESGTTGDECAWVTLVSRGIPVQILATCRLINQEASPILRSTMETFLPHVMCNDAGAELLIGGRGPGILMPLLVWLNQHYTGNGQVPAVADVSITWRNDAGVGRWLTKSALLLRHHFSIQDPHKVDPLSFRIMIQVKDVSPDNVSTKKNIEDWPAQFTLMDNREKVLLNNMLYWHFNPFSEHHLLYKMLRGMTVSQWKLETVQEVTTAIMYFIVHFQVNHDPLNPAYVRAEPVELLECVNGVEPGYEWWGYYPPPY